jgi:hypothetical protein
MKILHSVKTNSENLTYGKIVIYYQKNEQVGTDTWIPIGEATQAYHEFVLEKGEINQFRIKLGFYTTSATQPVRLLGMEIPGMIFSPLKYQWLSTYEMDGFRQVDKNGDPDLSPDEIVKFLQDAHQNGQVLLMRSPDSDMDGKKVMTTGPAIVKEMYRTEDGITKWRGFLSIALREVEG